MGRKVEWWQASGMSFTWSSEEQLVMDASGWIGSFTQMNGTDLRLSLIVALAIIVPVLSVLFIFWLIRLVRSRIKD